MQSPRKEEEKKNTQLLILADYYPCWGQSCVEMVDKEFASQHEGH